MKTRSTQRSIYLLRDSLPSSLFLLSLFSLFIRCHGIIDSDINKISLRIISRQTINRRFLFCRLCNFLCSKKSLDSHNRAMCHLINAFGTKHNKNRHSTWSWDSPWQWKILFVLGFSTFDTLFFYMFHTPCTHVRSFFLWDQITFFLI